MEYGENSRIIKKVFSFAEDRRMFDKGDGIIVGLSGGADSVCLLFLLCLLREKYDLKLKAVHVNHGIREEAGDDAAYAEEICRKLGVDIEIVCANVPQLAKEWGMSEEEAGRKVRYEAFEKTALENGFNKVAVAHNMNDNAETVLFHLFRGSGLHGLTGIPESRQLGQCRIIRPILCLERNEIETVLKNEGIKWVTDRTNLEDEYSRNRIRHIILPEAERLAECATVHICESAASLAETEDLLDELEKDCTDKSVTKISEGEYRISVSKGLNFHKVIIKRTVLSVLGAAAGGRKDIGSIQVAQVMELIEKSGNRRIDLAKGLSAERSYDDVVIKNKILTENSSGSCLRDIHIAVTCTDADKITGGINKFIETVTVCGRNNDGENAELNKYTKWLDYDKINGQPLVRTRESGDYITVSDGKGKIIQKSLKDFMINCKIPADKREKIPVVAVGSHCIWLVGYRISEICKLSVDTKRIAKLQLMSTENDECAES